LKSASAWWLSMPMVDGVVMIGGSIFPSSCELYRSNALRPGSYVLLGLVQNSGLRGERDVQILVNALAWSALWKVNMARYIISERRWGYKGTLI